MEQGSRTLLTFIGDVKAGFVLWIIAVEEEAGLVGGAKERLRDDRTAEPVNHWATVWGATPNLQVIMNRLGGEVQEL